MSESQDNPEVWDECCSLEGQLLVAMPEMADTRFERTVIYLCVHNEDGALGLVINKPVDSLRLGDLVDRLPFKKEDLPPLHKDSANQPILFGGPVETGRGFVLHSSDYDSSESTVDITSHIHLTGTLDILKSIMAGTGPRQSLLVLGYAGWGPGQLESEIRANGWLHCMADPTLVFSEDFGGKYTHALKGMGITPGMLSGSAGHA